MPFPKGRSERTVRVVVYGSEVFITTTTELEGYKDKPAIYYIYLAGSKVPPQQLAGYIAAHNYLLANGGGKQ